MKMKQHRGLTEYERSALKICIAYMHPSRGGRKIGAEISGRPPLTKDEIPPIFYRHYQAYKSRQLNVSEPARVCDMSRTTVCEYIEVIIEI